MHIKLTLSSNRSQRVPPLGVPIWSTLCTCPTLDVPCFWQACSHEPLLPPLMWELFFRSRTALIFLPISFGFQPRGQHMESFPNYSLLPSIMYYPVCDMFLIFLCISPTGVQVPWGQERDLCPLFTTISLATYSILNKRKICKYALGKYCDHSTHIYDISKLQLFIVLSKAFYFFNQIVIYFL